MPQDSAAFFLFKALEPCNVFTKDVKFYVHDRSHFYMAEVGVLSGIRNDGDGERVVRRLAYSQ